jgi:PAS domain S-box-containing protein
MPSLPIECGPAARAAFVQAVAGLAVISYLNPGSNQRVAIGAACMLSILAMPFARCAAHLSRDHPSVYWWAGRAWTVAIPALCAKTIPGAFDGSGPAMAERVTTPFTLAALVGLAFGVGAQGALLGVTKEAVSNSVMLMVVMAAIKLQAAYTPAYLLLQVTVLGGVTLGYACVAKYADLHEAMHEAAEAVVVGAAAREPFVVTDAVLNVRAVNQRLLDVFGYEEHELVGRPVMELLNEASSFGGDHAWIRRTLFEAASRKENPNGHVWSVRTKKGQAHLVRITLGETRCPISAMRMFTAQFTSMRLEHRNQQLQCEKEKLQWEVASHHDGEEDPRERLGATVFKVRLECHDCGVGKCTDDCPLFNKEPHRTLGAMQDQATTDEAVSCANSFDHVNSSVASPTAPGQTLIAPAPPRTASPMTSCTSLESSVMDTVSEAAEKDITRAPPPPKPSRLPRPKTVCSEPSSVPRPKTGNNPRKRAVPAVERIGPDPREDC